MRAAEWINYEERFDAVAAHISGHLNEPLDLIRLAEVAGLSPKHWHRVFTSAFGETLAAFVKRVRMQRAAFLLANTPGSITEIAAACGYPNVSSFTRAFAAAYDMPPGRYRISGRHTEFRRAHREFDSHAFDVEIRTIDRIECLAVPHRGTFVRIDEAFHDLQVWSAANGHEAEPSQMLGVFLSDPSQTPDAELRSLACIPRPFDVIGPPAPLSDGAAEIIEHTVEGGTYAILPHFGPYADMPAKYEWLFGSWVPASGRALADAPVVEHYVSSPRNTAPHDILTEIWLPLQP